MRNLQVLGVTAMAATRGRGAELTYVPVFSIPGSMATAADFRVGLFCLLSTAGS